MTRRRPASASGSRAPAPDDRSSGRARRRQGCPSRTWSPTRTAHRRSRGCERQREETAQRARERQRVVRDAVTGARHGVVIDPIDGAQTRSEERLAHLDPKILRDVALAAEEHRRNAASCGSASGEGVNAPVFWASARVLARSSAPSDLLDAAVGAGHEGVVLVAQAEVERQLVVHLPPVARIRSCAATRAWSSTRTGRFRRLASIRPSRNAACAL